MIAPLLLALATMNECVHDGCDGSPSHTTVRQIAGKTYPCEVDLYGENALSGIIPYKGTRYVYMFTVDAPGGPGNIPFLGGQLCLHGPIYRSPAFAPLNERADPPPSHPIPRTSCGIDYLEMDWLGFVRGPQRNAAGRSLSFPGYDVEIQVFTIDALGRRSISDWQRWVNSSCYLQ